MRSHARVVIVGGGAMGVSLLYHLSKHGWDDVVLVEKNELTAGSTWHAAGLATNFAHSLPIQLMRGHSINLYKSVLEQETGDPVGFHACGALRMTRCEDRMDEFRHVRGLGAFIGNEFHILSPSELKEIYPLVELDGLIGAIYEPNDGHVDPTLATNAMAKGARSRGAEIYRHTKVVGIDRRSDGEWLVRTDKGDIVCDHVVNAAGTWCREIGEMMGLDLPVVPMLHQYLVTDRVAALDVFDKELPIIRDPEESWYVRQERDGFIIGPYEKKAHPWSVDGVPPEFGMELLPPELEWMEDILALSMARIPVMADAGLKTVVNGPITFTPDANPLIGPAFGLDNSWLLTGSSMGVMEGGGAGMMLAEWIVNGEQPMDMLAVDPRRFGDFADRDYRLAKANDGYGRQFAIHYPVEEMEAGRPCKTTPLHDRLKGAGACMGFAYGFERPNWFAPEDEEARTINSFRRTNWFDAVGRECKRVHHHVGLSDMSVFSKFDVTGADADAFMETLGANRPPQKPGKLGLIHALTASGGVASEFTVVRRAAGTFYLTSAAASRRQDADLLRIHAKGFSDISITDRTDDLAVLGIMGPKSRAVLAALTGSDLSDECFPWLSAKTIRVGDIAVLALRVSYIGELGWELHCAMADQARLHDAIHLAGRDHDIGYFGAYAANSMRLEKAYRAWGLDFTIERTPLEAGVGFLVKTDDRQFQGRDAMLERANSGKSWSMHLLELDPAGNADPFYAHTVLKAGKPVGMVTSGAYGHRTGKRLALAYFRHDAGDLSKDLTVDILGKPNQACLLQEPPYDPRNEILKSGKPLTTP